MGREKEIEEMANILWHIPNNYYYYLNSYNDCKRIAECIYDDGGYRKQSNGEWISNDLGGYTWAYYCSECGWIDGYPFNDRHRYCPNCGAKMGGEE